jgi:hypothetical protein
LTLAIDPIAIGIGAGTTNQTSNSIAIGYNAGNSQQGSVGADTGYCIAIGPEAGKNGQFAFATAIGAQAGYINQGTDTVAIGDQAGYNSQASTSIAIGAQAGYSNQHGNTTILNASGNQLNSQRSSAFYVAPINSNNAITLGLGYDTVNNEIVTTTGVGGGISMWNYRINTSYRVPNSTGATLNWNSVITNTGNPGYTSYWTSPYNCYIKLRYDIMALTTGGVDITFATAGTVPGVGDTTILKTAQEYYGIVVFEKIYQAASNQQIRLQTTGDGSPSSSDVYIYGSMTIEIISRY